MWTRLKSIRSFLTGRSGKIKAMCVESFDWPLVVVFGATGVGKSKLGVRLAAKFNGEVISADSMQIYKNLDILTNKIKDEEACGIPHHLMNLLEPWEEYKVGDFKSDALEVISKIVSKGKIPIVVGGTNYYIEALLWNVLIEREVLNSEVETARANVGVNLEEESLLLIPTNEAFALLERVDPISAGTLHPNNRRKILRALQVLWQTGRCLSSVHEEQHSHPGGSSLGGPLRFPNAIMFWLHADQNVLDDRIVERTGQMLSEGLVEELQKFHDGFTNEMLRTGKKLDYTRGIYQSIGLRNFHEFLMIPKENRGSNNSQLLYARAVEDLKISTKRYARKQKKWILNRFLRNPERQAMRLFGLDASNLDLWDVNVERRASDILSMALKSEPIPYPVLKIEDIASGSEKTRLERVPTKTKRVCVECDRVFVGDVAWTAHMKSRKHMKTANKRKRKAESQIDAEVTDKRVSVTIS
ncbi:unnamed protein product [Notodromas monacha]|uniref:C2H2-type domain-containing protein n=1 Tax=Notodromas monacha TaxID=399045 RepID=A0A7R9BKA2_9CRUS|nr:unnamed protein product [Notodromas monacha]CAG0916263.1 unnamed protein product [Notodromas monacha]